MSLNTEGGGFGLVADRVEYAALDLNAMASQQPPPPQTPPPTHNLGQKLTQYAAQYLYSAYFQGAYRSTHQKCAVTFNLHSKGGLYGYTFYTTLSILSNFLKPYLLVSL